MKDGRTQEIEFAGLDDMGGAQPITVSIGEFENDELIRSEQTAALE